jgi:hypothetical protein
MWLFFSEPRAEQPLKLFFPHQMSRALKQIKRIWHFLICKSSPPPPEDIEFTTEGLSAEEFAKQVGIKVQVFSDSQEDAMNSTIISSNGLTSTVCVSNTFPKLDMSLFQPLDSMQSVTSPSLHSLQSSSTLLESPVSTLRRRSSEGTVSRIALTRTNTDDSSASVEMDKVQKGRFIMTYEKVVPRKSSIGSPQNSRFLVLKNNIVSLDHVKESNSNTVNELIAG